MRATDAINGVSKDTKLRIYYAEVTDHYGLQFSALTVKIADN